MDAKETFQLKPSPRFFSGRPLIDDKLAPRFFYQDDNLRGDKISLAEVIEQEPLPSGLSAQLDLELRHVVDVCNILKLAETTRDFLGVTGGDRHESLFKRMKKLRLAPTADVTQHLNQVGCENPTPWLSLTLATLGNIVRLCDMISVL